MAEARQFLKLLHKSKPSYRKKLLEGAPPRIIQLLSQCAMNILQGQIMLTATQKKKLSKHKSSLRQLASHKTSHTQKKKILQKGGLLPAFLLPLLAPVAGSILGATVGKIVNKIF